jgi:hypothetical protein
MSYTLTISIDSQSVQQIVAAGQYVTVAQSVQSYVQSAPFAKAFATVPGPALAIAWLTFSPYPTNTITWSPPYSLYASSAGLVNGVAIQPVATQSASESLSYPFQKFVFGTPSAIDSPGYFVRNLQGSAMTFGLALAATLNQVSQPLKPINASTVLNNQIAWFTPAASVAVFLSTISTSGTVFYQFGEPVYYALSGGSVSLQYQASNSTFVQTTS